MTMIASLVRKNRLILMMIIASLVRKDRLVLMMIEASLKRKNHLVLMMIAASLKRKNRLVLMMKMMLAPLVRRMMMMLFLKWKNRLVKDLVLTMTVAALPRMMLKLKRLVVKKNPIILILILIHTREWLLFYLKRRLTIVMINKRFTAGKNHGTKMRHSFSSQSYMWNW
uniref:Uncharacterized protein n=1 Tax=Solanum lycopersicum TaxID=4081 RepID=A0A3Q7EV60_SOLLC